MKLSVVDYLRIRRSVSILVLGGFVHGHLTCIGTPFVVKENSTYLEVFWPSVKGFFFLILIVIGEAQVLQVNTDCWSWSISNRFPCFIGKAKRGISPVYANRPEIAVSVSLHDNPTPYYWASRQDVFGPMSFNMFLTTFSFLTAYNHRKLETLSLWQGYENQGILSVARK